MEYVIPKDTFNGRMNEVVLGTGNGALTIGGDASYPFHYFEGSLPNMPRIAMEVCDHDPSDWAEGSVEPFSDVHSSPAKWARKCVDTYGAKAIYLKLETTDPGKEDSPPGEAASLAKKVAEAIEVPLIVYGTGQKKKDTLVLTEVAKACKGRNLFLGPVFEENFQEIATAAAEFGHGVILKTSVEISPAKELNIKLIKIITHDKIMFDPDSMAVGYGMEFIYSLMEQVRQGALFVNDVNLQMPFFVNLGGQCWSTMEAKESKEQGIMWEAISSMTLLLAGANLVVVRHPEAYQLLEQIIEGGGARNVHE